MPPPSRANTETRLAPNASPTSASGFLKMRYAAETPRSPRPTTMNPVTAPPRNATCSALFSPPRAASAARTFARTLMLIPTYPAAADRAAPTPHTASVLQPTNHPLPTLPPPRAARPLRLDSPNGGQPRPLPGGRLELLKSRFVAFSDQLHGPVVVVANPALESQLPCLSLDEVAESNALHIAPDHRVQPLHAYMVAECKHPASSPLATSLSADSPSTRTRTG